MMQNLCGRHWRRAGLLTAVVGSALLLTACGTSSPEQSNGQPPGKSTYEQAVAYSKCMRENGDPAFPDPNSKGIFVNNGNLDLSSPAYQKAAAACKTLAPAGAADPQKMQQDFDKLLKFSACMREHGIAKFPDPTMSGGGLLIPLNKTDIDMESAQFKAAQQACQSLRPGGGG